MSANNRYGALNSNEHPFRDCGSARRGTRSLAPSARARRSESRGGIEPLERRMFLSASFFSAVANALGSNPDFIAAGDFNGDGKNDLVASSYNGSNLSILLGNGNGTFAPPTTIALANAPDFVTAADVNADGKIDLLTASFDNNSIAVLFGNGNGTFGSVTDYAAGAGPRALALGDFTGDGELDIAVAKSFDTSLTLLINNGNGTFAPAVTTSLAFTPSDLVTGDFNNDGKTDLAAADFFGDQVAILPGNGNGTFQSAITHATGQGPASIAAGDFNGDGKLDLATANFYADTLSVLSGNGNGTLNSPTTLTVGSGSTFVAAADIDADGKVDLVSVNANDDNLSVFSGNGNGTFQLGANYATAGSPRSIVLSNFNSGNVLDAAVANQGADEISVMLGSSAIPPTADAGGPYYVNEGGIVHLDATGSSGPDLTYTWDLDGDGNFGETGSAGARGDEIGANPTFYSAGIDGLDSRIVQMRATTSAGLSDISSATIYIRNAAPTLVISGNSTAATGATYTLNLSSTDPGADTITSWLITWGDGTNQTVSGDPSSITKTFADPGSYTITATATDEDGTYSANSLNVTVTTTPSDPVAPVATVDSLPNQLSNGTYYFIIRYTDNVAIDDSTIDVNDTLVTGPNGFSAKSRVVSISADGAGTRIVTYRVDPLGGSWDQADNGIYTLTLRSNQVADTSGNFVPSAILGSFQVFILPADSAGNTMERARNLGAINSGTVRVAEDGVGAVDRNDYYSFPVNSSINLSAKLYNLTDNADMMLLNSAGNRLAYSRNAGSSTENFTVSLSRGTYYIRVLYTGEAGTTYRLRLEGAAPAAAPIPDITSTDLGSIAPGNIRAVTIASPDSTDAAYYRFQVTASTTTYLKLYQLTDDANLELLDSDGQFIASSANTGSSDERITLSLAAGTYYARVSFPTAIATGYRLRVEGLTM